MKVKGKIFGKVDIEGYRIPLENLKKVYKQAEGKPVLLDFDYKQVIGIVKFAKITNDGDIIVESELDDEVLKKLNISLESIDMMELAGCGTADRKVENGKNIEIIKDIRGVGLVMHSSYNNNKLKVIKKNKED